MKKTITLVFLLVVSLTALPVSADPTMVESGFTVEVFATGLRTPNDLAYDPAGSLLVSQTDNAAVSDIKILAGGTAGSITMVASGIPDAEGLALDASGNLFVSNWSDLYKVAGGKSTVFASGFNDAEGLAIDQAGDLFVADDVSGGIRISKIDVLPNGSAGSLSTFATVLSDPGSAADIEFGASGDLFVADGRDQVWIIEVQDGSAAAVRPLVGGLDAPFALAFDSKGNLFVGGSSGDIWSIDSDGGVNHFATGLQGAEGLAFGPSDTLFVSEAFGGRISKITPVYERVAVDVKPQSCPNPLNCRRRGVLPVAILGTEDLDVARIDPNTIQIEGVSPIRWSIEDVATPFEPFAGKEACVDCITEGPDGFTDLTLKFDAQEVLEVIGPVEDEGCIVLELTGSFSKEYGGTPIIGEDVLKVMCQP